MSAAEIQGHLLATWINHEPIETMRIHCIQHGLTAELNGVRMFTGPKSVMDRKSPFEQYKEVPGLSWFFLNDRSEFVRGFDGAPNGSTCQGTIEDVAKYVPDLVRAEWAYTKRSA